jgi:hypothetical protein
MGNASTMKKMQRNHAEYPAEPSQKTHHDTTELRNHYGHTWAEHEAFIRSRLHGLPFLDVEREVVIQEKQFALTAEPSIAFERSKKLVESAYHATPPAARKRFIELLRKDRT